MAWINAGFYLIIGDVYLHDGSLTRKVIAFGCESDDARTVVMKRLLENSSGSDEYLDLMLLVTGALLLEALYQSDRSMHAIRMRHGIVRLVRRHDAA